MGGLRSLIGKLFSRSVFPDSSDVIIFGLGNPGSRYESTRHNIGFRVADALIERLIEKKEGSSSSADWVFGKFASKNVIIAKPLTFMNQSGIAVKTLVNQLHSALPAILVIVDDFNIPLGTLRARRGGSHGGHNGLKSITSQVGPDFPRLRIGIGPLPENTDIIEFVLGEFSASEEHVLGEIIPKAVAASELFVKEGIDTVMNKFNK